MANREILLETIEQRPELCDDCLSRITGIRPRQQVNTICRALEGQGVLTRHRGRCSSCRSVKKTNVLASSGPVPTKSAVASTPADVDVVELQRQLVSMLDSVEGAKRRRDEGASARIGRLMDADMIPTNVGICMRTINSFRNTVVHDRYVLQPKETSVVMSAWDIISSWLQNRR